jgi:hypothetical protein
LPFAALYDECKSLGIVTIKKIFNGLGYYTGVLLKNNFHNLKQENKLAQKNDYRSD